MLRDITLGQFFPGSSVIHRADPRMKIILCFLYIIFLFLAKNIITFCFMILFVLIMILVSRISVKVILKGLKPLLFFMAFTAFFNLFWTNGERVIFDKWFITIYYEGVVFAVKMIVRVICMIIGTSIILTYTTSPIALTDGMEQLLAPLKKIRMPVHEFTMMMTIALRFIPTLIEETDKIMNAQKARGADFNSGGLIKRARALLPVLIPLFASAFRRAGELATAMECRCYRGDYGRTRLTKLHYHIGDFVLLFVMLSFGASIVLLDIYAESITLTFTQLFK